MPGVIPYLTVDDGDAAIKFYESAFGAACEMRMPSEDGRVMHASLQVNGGGGTFAPKRLGGTAVTIHLEFGDAEPAWECAVGAGAEVVMPLESQFWGAQYGKLRDPFGHVWWIGGPEKK